MTPTEEVRRLREAAQVALTVLRCVTMKRALVASGHGGSYNFFNLYDGCLTDVAVLAWCKLFGSNAEETHWKNLFPDTHHAALRGRIADAIAAEQQDYEALWDELKNYRDKLAAHHTYDESTRPARYPFLGGVRRSAFVLYEEIWARLNSLQQASSLPQLDATTSERMERQWTEVARAAVIAVREFPRGW